MGNDVLQRLARAKALLSEGLTRTAADSGEILRKRAQRLARTEAPDDPGERLELVVFLLAAERYGIDCNLVREVLPLRTLTPIPGVPDFVFGITNVRGQILTVLDLKKFFDLPDQGITDLTRVIIVQQQDMEFGILAERILPAASIKKESLQAPPPTLSGMRRDYVRGVTNDFLVVLDGERLLTDKRIVVDQKIGG